MNEFVYTPIVKTKRGEAKALIELDGSVKKKIIPFFDVLALKAEAQNGSDVHEHMVKQSLNIISAWKQKGLCYVDLFDVTPTARGLNGSHPATIVHEEISSNLVHAIPVVGIERDIAYKLAIRSVIASGVEAIAIRLDTEDIQLPSLLAPRISQLVAELGATGIPLHIFMDFRSIELIATDTIQSQCSKALNELRKLNPARIVFAASAIVPNMAKFKRNTLNRVARRDFLTWNLMAQSHLDLDYADYGVVHPDYFDFDPRMIKPAAKIRYTTDSEWLIVKGACWRDDTSQHHSLSKMLLAEGEFRDDGCWGAKYIKSAALGRPKYGTLETWVTIDQNSHITHSVKQLANVSATVKDQSTAPVDF